MTLVLAGAQFLIVCDFAGVTVALPTLARAFGLDRAAAQWALSAYAVPFGGFLLVAGRLADLVARRRLFIVATLVFALAAAAGATAASWSVLLSARAVQGLAAAVIAPSALALLTSSLAAGARDWALAVNGAMLSCGGVVGVLLGGVLTSVFGWRSFLILSAVIALALAVAALLLLGADQPAGEGQRPGLVGAILITTGFVGIILATIRAGSGQFVVAAVPPGLAGGGLLAAWAFVESRSQVPLIPRPMRTDRSNIRATAAVLLAGASLGGTVVVVSFYLQQALSYGPGATGVVFAVPGGASALVAVAAGRLVRRWGAHHILSAGLALQSLGAFALTMSVGSRQAWVLTVPLTLETIGNVLAFVAAGIIVVGGAAAVHRGVAGGALNAAGELGAAVGVALQLTLAGGAFTARHGPQRPHRLVELTAGAHHALLAGALLAAAGLVCACSIHTRRHA